MNGREGQQHDRGDTMTIEEEIGVLKQEHKALILAHNYTRPEIQDLADFVGDSLELARKAAECHAPVIVFCGVRFMAETAKILSPESIVLHPNPHSGCPMADMATPGEVANYRKAHPNTLVVAYVNTTAATKTEVDLCCTSGNAEKLIAGLPSDQKILFLPDANLGANLNGKLNRITAAKEKHPDALVLVHPECTPAVVALADRALSTGGMLKFVRESERKEFIIGTECGILHRMRKENPDKNFYPLEPAVLCPNMKKITVEDVLFALRDLSPRIELDDAMRQKAKAPIDRMLEVLP